MAAGGEKEKVQEEERLREKRRQFEDVAVSGVQVVGFSGVSWVGYSILYKCSFGWFVMAEVLLLTWFTLSSLGAICPGGLLR